MSAPSIPGEALAVVGFGEAAHGTLTVPLRWLGGERRVETWPCDDGVIFGSAVVNETKPLEELTRETYARIIEDVRAQGHPHFLRIWNHLGDLNSVERGLERYKRFCAGRSDAFAAASYPYYPAASAVGMRERKLVIFYLAAREPGVQIENPRQVSAYRYPAQYGPKSPSFSRATVWRDLMFVSGTASIVGHETLHPGDVAAQLDETLRNIETLVPRADVIAAKTYIRHASDYDFIASRLDRVFPANMYLEADICRRDLLLEIEVLARVTR